jgi:hypothetical protein
MSLEKKIIEEVQRYNKINKYIVEQETTTDPLADFTGAGTDETLPPPTTDTPPPTGPEEIAEPIDTATDPDVEKLDDEGKSVDEKSEDSSTEELDITDLVSAQKDIQSKQDEYMSTMFEKLEDLTSKLEAMDSIFEKINSLESKIEKYREKTPEEKLHLRSLDSYPFNQKLTDFFEDKKEDMEKSGKNEYVLTDDEVENFSPNEIKKTFNKFTDQYPKNYYS